MKKILLVSDSPYATTGLGRMSKYFLQMLPEFEWHIWGFLHPEYHVKKARHTAIFNPEDFKAKFNIVAPRMFTDDQYGLDYMIEYIKSVKPDFLITSMDYSRIMPVVEQIKQLQFTMEFKWINYFPMDREDFKDLEFDGYRFPDVNVCITKFGVDKLKKINPKADIKQIWHPIDRKEFPAVSDEEIKDFRAKTWPTIEADTFLFGTVNRSFARKDTARLVRAFTEFLKQNDNSYAYVHGRRKTFEGIDLALLGFENGMPAKTISFLPDNISEFDGVSGDALNKIYRSLDMFVTASSGEGFGFTTVEALLTGTPIIAPKNTSFPELVQDFGYLIEPTDSAFHYNGTTTMWPLVNLNDLVDGMNHVKSNIDEYKAKAEAGSEWVRKNLNLNIIAKQWREILK